MNKRILLAGALVCLLAASCAAPPTVATPAVQPSPTPAATRTAPPTATFTATHTTAPTHTLAPSRTATITATPPPSDTPTIPMTPKPTSSPTVTLTPTAVTLQARVNTPAQCRYGPGRGYLYKLGLEVGDALAVIGRNEKATWAQVTPLDRHFPCWVSAELIDIDGDPMSVPFAYTWLPKSPFYGPLSDVHAVRHGSTVVITWNPFKLRKGDEAGAGRYLVEAWVCDGGEVTLITIATDEPYVEFTDSAGCAGGSRARVYGVEKHGYTPPVQVSW